MAQDYQARLRIPVDGDQAMRLFTRSGTLVADGYLRVVIGGRGALHRIPDGMAEPHAGASGRAVPLQRSARLLRRIPFPRQERCESLLAEEDGGLCGLTGVR